MKSMQRITLATFFIDGNDYDIDGWFDEDTPTDGFDFYDIFDKQGTCLNEGEAYYQFPTYDEVRKLIDKEESNG